MEEIDHLKELYLRASAKKIDIRSVDDMIADHQGFVSRSIPELLASLKS